MILSNPLSFTTLPSTNPILNPNPDTSFSSYQWPARSRRRFRYRCRRSGGFQWDSNAESFRFRFRDDEEEEDGGFRDRRSSGWRWWSDEPEDESDDVFDPFDEESESIWVKIWIFKVFKAYGYMLPAIIGSLLLATDPKAFLMALTIPLGQSAILLAFDLKSCGEGNLKGHELSPKTMRRPFARSQSNFRKQEKEERSSDGRGRNSYQSWVSTDSGAADRMSGSRRSSFGGWDELDNEKRPMRGQSPAASESLQAETLMRVKLSKRRRYSFCSSMDGWPQALVEITHEHLGALAQQI